MITQVVTRVGNQNIENDTPLAPRILMTEKNGVRSTGTVLMVDLQEHESGRWPYRIEQMATDYQHIVNGPLCFGRVEPFETLLDSYRAIQLKAN